MMKLVEIFKQLFNKVPLVVRAPGRINLIGEHTDYNGGLSMPTAINRYVYVAVSKRSDGEVHLYCDRDEHLITNLSLLAPCKGKWHTYIQGVAKIMIQRGYALGGFNLYLTGDIPIGAGMSSSAALCCGTVMALNDLFGHDLSLEDMALIAQKSEHVFAGVNCGLMDQYACLFSRNRRVMKLDFDTMRIEYFPLRMMGRELLLFNTKVKHVLADSAYNTRREECERAVSILKLKRPMLTSLRGTTLNELFDEVLLKDPLAYKRAKYVLEENNRVELATQMLLKKEYDVFGSLMIQSHKGLSEEFKVSCFELDTIQQLLAPYKFVYGARMMGGGFGGCVLGFLKSSTTFDEMLEKVAFDYHQLTGNQMEVYRLRLSEGARKLNALEASKVEVSQVVELA